LHKRNTGKNVRCNRYNQLVQAVWIDGDSPENIAPEAPLYHALVNVTY